MQGNELGPINAAIDKLTAASHKLAEAMYKSASGPDGTPPGGDGPGPDGGPVGGDKKKDDVVDAEFVDVDDKKVGAGWSWWLVAGGCWHTYTHGVRRTHDPTSDPQFIYHVSQARLLRNSKSGQRRQPG